MIIIIIIIIVMMIIIMMMIIIIIITRTCYLELRRINAIRHYLSEDGTNGLNFIFVLSRPDLCNTLPTDSSEISS